jgi:hypothetical protein
MYGVIRRYRFDPQSSADIDHHVRIGIVRPIVEIPGFVAYYWLDTAEGMGIAVNVFEDQTGAEESNRVSADYLERHNLTEIVGKPEIIAGAITAHAPT